MIQALKKSDDIVFLACGTSHYASLLGVDYMHYLGKRSESYIASEWAYYPNVTAEESGLYPSFAIGRDRRFDRLPEST
jgi:fructoselysine-6-P-deglycase FrlB-like protein